MANFHAHLIFANLANLPNQQKQDMRENKELLKEHSPANSIKNVAEFNRLKSRNKDAAKNECLTIRV